MIVLNTKTFDELKEEATSDLQAVGFNTSPGAIAKLFMNIVNQKGARKFFFSHNITPPTLHSTVTLEQDLFYRFQY